MDSSKCSNGLAGAGLLRRWKTKVRPGVETNAPAFIERQKGEGSYGNSN